MATHPSSRKSAPKRNGFSHAAGTASMPETGAKMEEARMVTAELFRQVPLFSGLADEDLESLIGVATRRVYPKEAVVFFENDAGDALFMILSGRVKVTILSDDGREIILAILSDNEFFGEMSLLDNEPRSATAIAMQETEMLILHQKEFLSIVEKRPRVLLNLLSTLSSRLRKANQQIGNLALHDVYGRVARILLEMASESGSRREDGRVAFRRPTHQEIASMIGATRETVSRMISDLNRQGYIEISGKNVIIQDALTRAFAHS
jgi:CRP/FNR family transcriptional regulator/CRP/FNR family cyclic AMP-dependent transcriptional regulator